MVSGIDDFDLRFGNNQHQNMLSPRVQTIAMFVKLERYLHLYWNAQTTNQILIGSKLLRTLFTRAMHVRTLLYTLHVIHVIGA